MVLTSSSADSDPNDGKKNVLEKNTTNKQSTKNTASGLYLFLLFSLCYLLHIVQEQFPLFEHL
jgi:hypothetical protein